MDARAALARLGDALSSMSSSRMDAQRRVVALEAENDALRAELKEAQARHAPTPMARHAAALTCT